jgi:hypothetical protein
MTFFTTHCSFKTGKTARQKNERPPEGDCLLGSRRPPETSSGCFHLCRIGDQSEPRGRWRRGDCGKLRSSPIECEILPRAFGPGRSEQPGAKKFKMQVRETDTLRA